jgi:hypothetical protein
LTSRAVAGISEMLKQVITKQIYNNNQELRIMKLPNYSEISSLQIKKVLNLKSSEL